jgi:hypothetical protein
MYDNDEIVIMVLDRGRIHVGRWWQEGAVAGLSVARTIRRWGTAKGLGQIAAEGPTDSTVLDMCGPVRVHILKVVETQRCEPEAWKAVFVKDV